MSENQNFCTSEELLRSLANELKNPLILIAREAELDAMHGENPSTSSIQMTAEHALRLIDSYLLLAQSEYGQTRLPIENFGVGSAIYDVVEDLRPFANKYKIRINTDIHENTIISSSLGLKTALWCMTKMTIEHKMRSDDPINREVLIRARRHDREEIDVSVIGGMSITHKDIDLARRLQGKSRLALSIHSEASGVQLAIADMLASALGSGLHIAKSGKNHGLSLRLLKSRQLQLV